MNNTKTLTAKEKINFFKKELSMIQNETIRRIVEKALANVDDRFFFAPASSTGNYHPWWACVVHGLVYHTRMVAFLADINCDRFRNFAEDAAIDKDIVIAAAILHDSCKSGVRWEAKYTVHEHPLLPPLLIDADDLSEDEQKIWERICDVISTHMGEFTTSKRSKVTLPSLPVLPKQGEPLDPEFWNKHALHDADYAASRKEMSATWIEDLLGMRDNNEPQPEPLATEKQVNFIQFLISTGMRSGYDMSGFGAEDPSKLSSCQAGVMISQLKSYINFVEELKAPTH